MASKFYYWCPEQKKMIEGFRPVKHRNYGTAPMVIFDSMPPQYHEAAKMVVESRRTWKLLDKMHGTMTVGNVNDLEPGRAPGIDKEQHRRDIKQARARAVEAYKRGETPLTEAQKAACAETDARLSQQLGMDVRNIWKPKKQNRLKRNKNKKAA